MPREVDNRILRKLEEWKVTAEAPSEVVEFHRRLLHLQSRVERRMGVPRPGLSSEAVNERIERGLPLLSFDELALDWSLLQDMFVEVCVIFGEYPELFGEIPKSLRESEPRPSLPKQVAKAWFKGTVLPATIVGDGINKYLLGAMIHATLMPFLISHSKALLSLVNQEQWRRGYCPICGGNPDFAFLDKEYGARWLMCSRCDTRWLFQRLECPYCGNQNQDALAYFTNDEGVYRLYVCEHCRTYIKAIDLRRIKSEVLLPLERVMTLDMDRQGEEKGYKPGHFGVSSLTTPEASCSKP